MPRSSARAPVPARARSTLCSELADDFAAITGLAPAYDEQFAVALAELATYLEGRTLRSRAERCREFLGQVNGKFRVNAAALGAFYTAAAGHGSVFHFHHKKTIQRAFDVGDRSLLEAILAQRDLSPAAAAQLLQLFVPAPQHRTIEIIRAECDAPSKLRRELGDRALRQDILSALFAAFLWVSLPEQDMHACFDPEHIATAYEASYWRQLHARSPALFNREHALHVRRVAATEASPA